MSYIAFDLDALNACPMVGAACGLSAEQVSHGLLQMWAWCFRAELDTISTTHVRGFFYGSDATEALSSFGFLESVGGSWRVRGASRYLRIKTAQREAGKASASNLRNGRQTRTKAGGTAEVDLRVSSGSTSESTSGSAPALTPTTDDRRPSTESKASAGELLPAPGIVEPVLASELPVVKETRYRKPKAPLDSRETPPDPRHAPLVKALVEAAPGYAFTGRDAKAVAALLAMGEPAEVLSRWRRALAHQGWPTVRAIHELPDKWAHFATATPLRAVKGPIEPATTHTIGDLSNAL